MNEWHTHVSSVLPQTGVLHSILAVSHRIAPWQELGLSVEVMFGSGLPTEIVGRVERFPSVRSGGIVVVSRHDYTGRMK